MIGEDRLHQEIPLIAFWKLFRLSALADAVRRCQQGCVLPRGLKCGSRIVTDKKLLGAQGNSNFPNLMGLFLVQSIWPVLSIAFRPSN